jgi:hypothetical protein
MLAPWRRWKDDTAESIRLIAGLRNNTGFFKRMTSPSVSTDALESAPMRSQVTGR